MKEMIRPYIPQWGWNIWNRQRQNRLFREWTLAGCPVPPPHLVKQLAIKEYQEKYHCAVLVETGTYMGDMVEAQKTRFKQIFSIELGVELFYNAVHRFRNDKNVVIVQGDSGKVLPQILSQIHEPAIFWMDGHYSAGITAKGDKDCPIFEELDAIFQSKKLNHIILIDDARCFTGEGDYPSLKNLTAYIQSKNENYRVEVKNDIIRYVV